MGQALFSNINDIIYGKTSQAYNRVVKRFGTELKKQKIIPTVRTGFITNFLECDIITEKEIQRIFKFTWDINNFLYCEITIFNWE